MTPSDLDLARRIVACPAWKWRPGCRGEGSIYWKGGSERYAGRIDIMAGQPCVIVRRNLGRGTAEAIFFTDGPLPDLTDPATIGCVLALVREAWNSPGLNTYLATDGSWNVMSMGGTSFGRYTNGPSEAAALVAALEAAPKKE